MTEREQFHEFALEVEFEYQMGGLSDGLYEDYAWDIYQKMIEGNKQKPYGYLKEIDASNLQEFELKPINLKRKK